MSNKVTVMDQTTQVSTDVQGRYLSGDEIRRFGSSSLARIDKIGSDLENQIALGDLDEMGETIQDILELTRGSDPAAKSKIMGFLPRPLRSFVTKRDTAKASIDSLVRSLDTQTDAYRGQIGQLENIWNATREYYFELQRDIGELEVHVEFMTANPPVVDENDEFGESILQRHDADVMMAMRRLDQMRRSARLAAQSAPQITLLATNAQQMSEAFEDLKMHALPTMRRTAQLQTIANVQNKGAKINQMVKDASRQGLEDMGKNISETTALVYAGIAEPTFRNEDIERHARRVSDATKEAQRLVIEAKNKMIENSKYLARPSTHTLIEQK